MTEQLALLPPKLTDRQARALGILRAAGPDGMTGEDLGTEFGASFRWAKSTGLELARALKRKGYVRQARGGIYVALDAEPAKAQDVPSGMLRDDEEIPF